MDGTNYIEDNTTAASGGGAEGKNFNEFAYLLLRQWYWLLLAAILAVSVTWVYLKFVTPIYEIKGTMFIRNATSNVNTQQLLSMNLLQGDRGSYFNLETEMQLLKSRRLMRQVVDSLGIYKQYFVESAFRDAEEFEDLPVDLVSIYPQQKAYNTELSIKIIDTTRFLLIKEETDSLRLFFNVPFTLSGVTYVINAGEELIDETIRIKIDNPEEVAQKYADKLTVLPTSLGRLPSDVLELRLEDPNPAKAIAIVNTLVSIYNRTDLERKKLSERRALEFIDERLAYVTAELYSVEQQVEGYRRRRQLPSEISSSAQDVLSQLGERDNELAKIQSQLNLLERIDRVYQDETNLYQPLPMVPGVLEGALVQLVPQYNNLIVERELLLRTATPDNPAVRVVNDKLNQLTQAIQINLRNTRQQLTQEKRQLERRIEPIQERIEALPTYERELLQIMRQQQIKEQLFLFLLQRREETAIALSRQVSDSEMLDLAREAGLLHPKKLFIYISSLLLGLILPGGVMFLRYILDNRVHSEKELRGVTQAPLLSAINQAPKGSNIVVTKESRSAAAEAFRLLRTNIQFVNQGVDKPIYLMTSSMSGEGKTFVSINLGLSIAITGKKTLLIGMDMRKPKLGSYIFGGGRPPVGLSSYLVGEASVEDIIHGSQLDENLDVITSGPVPPNPAELLIGDRLESFIAEVKRRYDFIIIDAPPVGLVADAYLLSDYITGAFYVVRSGVTLKRDLRILDDIYRKKTLPKVGVILNGIKLQGGYYGRYYGDSRHSRYYKDNSKKNWFGK